MKKIIFFILIISFVLTVPGYAKEDAEALLFVSETVAKKRGYVDIKYAFDNYQRTAAFAELLVQQNRKMQADRNVLVAEIMKLQSSGKDRAKLDRKIIEIQRFDNIARTNLGLARTQTMNEISKEINEAIREIGVKESYSKIYDSRLKKKGKNLTDQLVELLNQKYKKKMAGRAES